MANSFSLGRSDDGEVGFVLRSDIETVRTTNGVRGKAKGERGT
jgi:hypothetical protein